MTDDAPIQRAIERICNDLGLPRGDRYTQDRAFELPAQSRGCDAAPRFLAAYARPDYGDHGKRELTTLSLDILNDNLALAAARGYAVRAQLQALLEEHAALRRDQIESWAQLGEPLDDSFAISGLLRPLLPT